MPILAIFPLLVHWGARLDALDAKKSIPKVDFTWVLAFFWTLGPPGRSPKAFLERHVEPTGALGRVSGPLFLHLLRA